jgi:hypothetical protein
MCLQKMVDEPAAAPLVLDNQARAAFRKAG